MRIHRATWLVALIAGMTLVELAEANRRTRKNGNRSRQSRRRDEFDDDEDVTTTEKPQEDPLAKILPLVTFKCKGRHEGYYADVQFECEVFHYCNGQGMLFTFMCPPTSRFNQKNLICDYDRFGKKTCAKSAEYFHINENIRPKDNNTITTTSTPELLAATETPLYQAYDSRLAKNGKKATTTVAPSRRTTAAPKRRVTEVPTNDAYVTENPREVDSPQDAPYAYDDYPVYSDSQDYYDEYGLKEPDLSNLKKTQKKKKKKSRTTGRSAGNPEDATVVNDSSDAVTTTAAPDFMRDATTTAVPDLYQENTDETPRRKQALDYTDVESTAEASEDTETHQPPPDEFGSRKIKDTTETTTILPRRRNHRRDRKLDVDNKDSSTDAAPMRSLFKRPRPKNKFGASRSVATTTFSPPITTEIPTESPYTNPPSQYNDYSSLDYPTEPTTTTDRPKLPRTRTHDSEVKPQAARLSGGRRRRIKTTTTTASPEDYEYPVEPAEVVEIKPTEPPTPPPRTRTRSRNRKKQKVQTETTVERPKVYYDDFESGPRITTQTPPSYNEEQYPRVTTPSPQNYVYLHLDEEDESPLDSYPGQQIDKRGPNRVVKRIKQKPTATTMPPPLGATYEGPLADPFDIPPPTHLFDEATPSPYKATPSPYKATPAPRHRATIRLTPSRSYTTTPMPRKKKVLMGHKVTIALAKHVTKPKKKTLKPQKEFFFKAKPKYEPDFDSAGYGSRLEDDPYQPRPQQEVRHKSKQQVISQEDYRERPNSQEDYRERPSSQEDYRVRPSSQEDYRERPRVQEEFVHRPRPQNSVQGYRESRYKEPEPQYEDDTREERKEMPQHHHQLPLLQPPPIGNYQPNGFSPLLPAPNQGFAPANPNTPFSSWYPVAPGRNNAPSYNPNGPYNSQGSQQSVFTIAENPQGIFTFQNLDEQGKKQLRGFIDGTQHPVQPVQYSQQIAPPSQLIGPPRPHQEPQNFAPEPLGHQQPQTSQSHYSPAYNFEPRPEAFPTNPQALRSEPYEESSQSQPVAHHYEPAAEKDASRQRQQQAPKEEQSRDNQEERPRDNFQERPTENYKQAENYQDRPVEKYQERLVENYQEKPRETQRPQGPLEATKTRNPQFKFEEIPREPEPMSHTHNRPHRENQEKHNQILYDSDREPTHQRPSIHQYEEEIAYPINSGHTRNAEHSYPVYSDSSEVLSTEQGGRQRDHHHREHSHQHHRHHPHVHHLNVEHIPQEHQHHHHHEEHPQHNHVHESHHGGENLYGAPSYQSIYHAKSYPVTTHVGMEDSDHDSDVSDSISSEQYMDKHSNRVKIPAHESDKDGTHFDLSEQAPFMGSHTYQGPKFVEDKEKEEDPRDGNMFYKELQPQGSMEPFVTYNGHDDILDRSESNVKSHFSRVSTKREALLDRKDFAPQHKNFVNSDIDFDASASTVTPRNTSHANATYDNKQVRRRRQIIFADPIHSAVSPYMGHSTFSSNPLRHVMRQGQIYVQDNSRFPHNSNSIMLARQIPQQHRPQPFGMPAQVLRQHHRQQQQHQQPQYQPQLQHHHQLYQQHPHHPGSGPLLMAYPIQVPTIQIQHMQQQLRPGQHYGPQPVIPNGFSQPLAQNANQHNGGAPSHPEERPQYSPPYNEQEQRAGQIGRPPPHHFEQQGHGDPNQATQVPYYGYGYNPYRRPNVQEENTRDQPERPHSEEDSRDRPSEDYERDQHNEDDDRGNSQENDEPRRERPDYESNEREPQEYESQEERPGNEEHVEEHVEEHEGAGNATENVTLGYPDNVHAHYKKHFNNSDPVSNPFDDDFFKPPSYYDRVPPYASHLEPIRKNETEQKQPEDYNHEFKFKPPPMPQRPPYPYYGPYDNDQKENETETLEKRPAPFVYPIPPVPAITATFPPRKENPDTDEDKSDTSKEDRASTVTESSDATNLQSPAESDDSSEESSTEDTNKSTLGFGGRLRPATQKAMFPRPTSKPMEDATTEASTTRVPFTYRRTSTTSTTIAPYQNEASTLSHRKVFHATGGAMSDRKDRPKVFGVPRTRTTTDTGELANGESSLDIVSAPPPYLSEYLVASESAYRDHKDKHTTAYKSHEETNEITTEPATRTTVFRHGFEFPTEGATPPPGQWSEPLVSLNERGHYSDPETGSSPWAIYKEIGSQETKKFTPTWITDKPFKVGIREDKPTVGKNDTVKWSPQIDPAQAETIIPSSRTVFKIPSVKTTPLPTTERSPHIVRYTSQTAATPWRVRIEDLMPPTKAENVVDEIRPVYSSRGSVRFATTTITTTAAPEASHTTPLADETDTERGTTTASTTAPTTSTTTTSTILTTEEPTTTESATPTTTENPFPGLDLSHLSLIDNIVADSVVRVVAAHAPTLMEKFDSKRLRVNAM